MSATKCQCAQCGSTDFKKEGTEFLRCAYCDSLYKMQEEKKDTGNAKVIIGKGANVVFGKNSNVVIKGGLFIDNGAHVEFLGKMEIVEPASQEKIEKAKEQLKLIKEEE